MTDKKCQTKIDDKCQMSDKNGETTICDRCHNADVGHPQLTAAHCELYLI